MIAMMIMIVLKWRVKDQAKRLKSEIYFNESSVLIQNIRD